MNSIVISGRFTNNPESKTGNDGKPIAHFDLADNYGQDKVSFFRCSAFGKTAELILNSCQKGHKLVVVGRMEEQVWNNNEGQKQRAWQCNVNTIDFIEPKGSAPSSVQPASPPQTVAHPAAGPQYAPPAPTQAPQIQLDAQGNQWQIINGAWQMIKPAAPTAPPFPPSNSPY